MIICQQQSPVLLLANQNDLIYGGLMVVKKIIIIVASLLTITALLFFSLFMIGGGIISGAFFNPRIDYRQMERIFVEDYDLLIVVVDYLSGSEHPTVNLFPERDNGIMSFFSDDLGMQHILISDENVVNAIETLRERGYRLISKNNDTIQFLRWSMRNRGHGIAYSINGDFPDSSAFSFLTKLEPLSVDGWFYYEEDFNEYRRRQQN